MVLPERRPCRCESCMKFDLQVNCSGSGGGHRDGACGSCRKNCKGGASRHSNLPVGVCLCRWCNEEETAGFCGPIVNFCVCPTCKTECGEDMGSRHRKSNLQVGRRYVDNVDRVLFSVVSGSSGSPSGSKMSGGNGGSDHWSSMTSDPMAKITRDPRCKCFLSWRYI